MNEMNTLQIAIDLTKLVIEHSAYKDLPYGPDGGGLAEFIQQLKTGLDAIVHPSKLTY